MITKDEKVTIETIEPQTVSKFVLEHAMKDATDDRMRDEIRRLMNRI